MNADDLRVSVLIPCYNAEAYIAEAIRSALDQTRRPDEVIVVDDGSGDRSGTIARRFGGIVRVLAGAHGGVSAARNIGLAEARAELIALLDADDVWERDKLARQVPRFADPEVGLTCSRTENIDANGTCDRGPWPQECPEGYVFERLYRDNWIPNATVVVRRNAVREVGGFDEALRKAEDFDLWLRLSQRWMFAVVPEVLAHYRHHAAQVTHHAAGVLLGLVTVQARYAAEFQERTGISPEAVRADMLRRVLAELESRYHHRRDTAAAGKLLMLVREHWPDPDASTRRRLRQVELRSRLPGVLFRFRDMFPK